MRGADGEPWRAAVDEVEVDELGEHALSPIAREVEGVSAGMLEDIAAGTADLNVATLQALARVLYPHAEFDPDSGMLRSVNRAEPMLLCTAPPDVIDPRASPYYFFAGPGAHLGPQPVVPPKPKAKTSRGGWCHAWL
jgi:hypothetical protein